MASVTLRFYAELNAFLPPKQRQRSFEAKLARAATAKHTIEACGVPHTEVALILVDGEPATFKRLLHEGERIAVFPSFQRIALAPLFSLNAPPAGKPRFIADCHLGGLARLLRMAGFDCTFRNDYRDREIAELAANEERIVLTRDKQLLMIKSIRHGAFVHALKAEAQFAEIVRRFALIGRCAPFSRCLICNVPLAEVEKTAIVEELPPAVRTSQAHFRRCPRCRRIYWPGSHWQRMRKLLERALAWRTQQEAFS
ncbi:MAG: Mut7-C ubiquitin/RNAse domain-containing protein [Rhodocyclaceae bacterium]|nr:Mut7-C ubiquitin/RNAse domain-containing protein [Rhodocyclaceae bacterium]